MPIEIKELRVSIQVTEKKISKEEIENMIIRYLQSRDLILKEDVIIQMTKKEQQNNNR